MRESQDAATKRILNANDGACTQQNIVVLECRRIHSRITQWLASHQQRVLCRPLRAIAPGLSLTVMLFILRKSSPTAVGVFHVFVRLGGVVLLPGFPPPTRGQDVSIMTFFVRFSLLSLATDYTAHCLSGPDGMRFGAQHERKRWRLASAWKGEPGGRPNNTSDRFYHLCSRQIEALSLWLFKGLHNNAPFTTWQLFIRISPHDDHSGTGVRGGGVGHTQCRKISQRQTNSVAISGPDLFSVAGKYPRRRSPRVLPPSHVRSLFSVLGRCAAKPDRCSAHRTPLTEENTIAAPFYTNFVQFDGKKSVRQLAASSRHQHLECTGYSPPCKLFQALKFFEYLYSEQRFTERTSLPPVLLATISLFASSTPRRPRAPTLTIYKTLKFETRGHIQGGLDCHAAYILKDTYHHHSTGVCWAWAAFPLKYAAKPKRL